MDREAWRATELRRQCGVSHKIRWGAQGVSRVVTGKSGLHARVEGECDLEEMDKFLAKYNFPKKNHKA